LVQRLPIDQRYSFSVLQKRAPLDFELLVTTLVRTAQGYSSHDQALDENKETDISPLSNLRLRDHEIMRMLTSGKSTDHIARELSLSPVTIRQDLSRIYETLIPQRTAGTNLRTLAISKYLADARSF
jgi:DNA-binding NarL/FixJ family response regulator